MLMIAVIVPGRHIFLPGNDVSCPRLSRSKLGTGKDKKPLKRLRCSPFREFVMFPVPTLVRLSENSEN